MGSRDRERKKRDRALHEARWRRGRQRQLQTLLRGLGFKGWSEPLLEALADRRYPEPDISLSAEVMSRAGAKEIGAAVRRAVEAKTVALREGDVQTSLASFFADYLSLADACRGEVSIGGNAGSAWSGFAAVAVPLYQANLEQGLSALVSAVDEALLPFCDLSENIYFARYTVTGSRRGPHMHVVVDVHRAQSAQLVRDGISRPAWRCGLPFGHKGISWVTWGEAEGVPASAAPADVYVQGHVLQRIRERLRFDEMGGVLDWLWQSLRKPTFSGTVAKRLVEFRIGPWRLGYLPVDIIDGRVLVTTFLFLTNAGTPEGDRLRAHTGFKTHQISWLKMDELPYFVLSDVQNDPGLRAVFAECGCEHLFDVMRPEARNAVLSLARETRRHLEMPPLPQMP